MIEIDVKRLTAQLSDSLAKADYATRQGHDALANGEESMANKWLLAAENAGGEQGMWSNTSGEWASLKVW